MPFGHCAPKTGWMRSWTVEPDATTAGGADRRGDLALVPDAARRIVALARHERPERLARLGVHLAYEGRRIVGSELAAKAQGGVEGHRSPGGWEPEAGRNPLDAALKLFGGFPLHDPNAAHAPGRAQVDAQGQGRL